MFFTYLRRELRRRMRQAIFIALGLALGASYATQNKLTTGSTIAIGNKSGKANNLGKWLALAVLVAAFLLASLLTMAAVSRRVREFGTLKALGWKSRRIIGQVMGEMVALGVIGGTNPGAGTFRNAASASHTVAVHARPPLSHQAQIPPGGD